MKERLAHPLARKFLLGSLFLVLGGSSLEAGITPDGSTLGTFSGYSDTWVGLSGSGSLLVNGGSQYTSNFLTIGYDPGSTGTMMISGSGSSATTNRSLYVGLNGSGTLIVKSGGRLVSNGVPLLPTPSIVQLGSNAGARGSVTIDGAGSEWYLPETGIGIGSTSGGAGSLTVSNGGKVTLGLRGIGLYSTDGLLVTGAGSKVEMLSTDPYNQFYVGGSGSVVGGATVSAGGVFNTVGDNKIGYFLGQQGQVKVTGEGSQWNVRGSLILGSSSGTGTVTVEDGGLLSVSAMTSATGTGDGVLSLGASPQSSNPGTPASTGTLNIGSGGAAGRLNVTEVNGYSGSSNPNLVPAKATLVFNHNASSYAFTNSAGNGILISGSTKVRNVAGTTVLSTPSTYTGGTEVTGGKLVVNNTTGSATGTGQVTIDVGGALGGSGFIGGDTFVAGTLAPGNSPGTLTFAQDLTLASSAVTLVELASGALYDRIVVGGELTFGGTLQIEVGDDFDPAGGQFQLFEAGTYSGNFDSVVFGGGYTGTFDVLTGTLTIVPETGSGVLVMLGIACLTLRRGRRVS